MISRPSLIWISTVLLFLAPAVNLVWRGGSGYFFFALALIALGAAVAYRKEPGYFSALVEYKWFTVASLLFVIVIPVQQKLLGFWIPRQMDPFSRFVAALPLLLFLRQMPTRYLKTIGWGCAAGALAVGIWAVIDRPTGGYTDANRLANSYTNAIPFGDTALLLAFLSLFTFGWDTPRNWRVLVPKLLALLAGGYASYQSGTRGGWLAIPVFIVLLGAQYGFFAQRKRLIVAVVAIVVGAGALLSTQRVQDRVEAATSDLTLFVHGDDSTPVGLRLQLWRAATVLYSEHPVLGIGKGRLRAALGDLAAHGIAKQEIVNERAHSDFFSAIAEMGTVGALGLLVFYFGMSVYFWRYRRADDPTIRTAAYSGLAVSFSTIVFGLTIDVLVPIMVTVLLALLGATFLAIIDARRRELAVLRK